MGRPRKRRREEARDTGNRDGYTKASEGNIVDAADIGSQESGSATFSGKEPGLGTEGFECSSRNFQGHDAVPCGVGNRSTLPNTKSFSFDIPEGQAPNLEQGLPDWYPSQDLGYPFFTFADVPMPMQTPPTVPDELENNGYAVETTGTGCSCLSNLYSMLEKFQSLPEPSFPYSMGALRGAASLSRGVVACHDCSKAYSTALQNSMLLGTLLQLLIMEYGKLLKHIDEKSKQAEKIVFRFGDPSSVFDIRHTGLPDCPMAINVDFSGDEWRTLARKAVVQEVLDNPRGSGGLFGLIQEMKDRQSSWHERFSEGQCTAIPSADHEKSAEPHNHPCVQMIYVDNLKRSLEALRL